MQQYPRPGAATAMFAATRSVRRAAPRRQPVLRNNGDGIHFVERRIAGLSCAIVVGPPDFVLCEVLILPVETLDGRDAPAVLAEAVPVARPASGLPFMQKKNTSSLPGLSKHYFLVVGWLMIKSMGSHESSDTGSPALTRANAFSWASQNSAW